MRRRLPLFQPGCLPQSKLTPLSIRAAARIRFLEPAAHFSRPPAKPAPADSVDSAKGYSPLFKIGRGRWGFRRLASPGTRRSRLKQDLADRIRRSFPVPAQASHCLVCWLILLSSNRGEMPRRGPKAFRDFLTTHRWGATRRRGGRPRPLRRRVPGDRGRPEGFPSLCVNYDTSRCRESAYFASVSP
jgi:hypothetical protein